MLSPDPCSDVNPPHSAAIDFAAPAVVLDTNVVLDWLVFRHPSCAGWTRVFSEKSVRWLASGPMKDELAHVLGRGVARARQPDLPAIWSAWADLATVADSLPLAGDATRVRCSDCDDQKFIDLALSRGARWLVSRDKAVLKLARRVRPLGLEILTPERWSLPFSAG